jgi:proteasome lid subunit RPN8/RPN11
MTIKEIQIPRKMTQQLLHLAQNSPEQEICGLIAAKNNQACRCYPINNVASQPETKFLLDAKQQIAAQVAMRENGEELFAVYHSHPTAPAQPSQTDIAFADELNALHLIISLNTKGVLEMRGFRLIHQQVQEVILVLTS